MKNNIKATVEWEDVNMIVVEESKHIVREMNGFANPHEILGIIGPSGGGKSAFLNALGGYFVDGIDTKIIIKINGIKIESKNIFKYIDYQTQFTPYLDKLTVIELLKYSIRIENDTVDKLGTILYSLGLKEIIHSRVDTISAGEKTRLSIAILLNSTKPILLFDEPLSPLDSYQAMFVINALRAKAAEGKTIIMSVHQPSLEILDFINRFYVISNGRNLYFGTLANMKSHFEKAGVTLKLMKDGNITDAVLEEITLSDSDPTSQQSIKKLSSYQDTFITNDEDLKIEYHKLPEISTQKNLPWYCYYLFISIIRETSSNIFSWVFIFSVWLPIVIFMAIPLYKPFLNSPTFNNYTFNVFKVYARLLEVSGEIYKLFLTYFETDNKCSLTPNDELLIGFNQIDFEGIPLILRIFIFYVILGMNFLFRFFLCNPKFHTNVFKVMTYNAKRELFKYSESYLCYVFVIAPLYLIANLLIDIYGMQSFNFEGVSFMSIPKYLIYNICQVPLYIISLNVFEVWFSSEYMTKSFFMKIANTIWIYLTLSAYCIAIVTFPRIFFKLIGYNNDDYSIKDMTPLLSYILTPFFNFSLLDLLSYSFVSIMVFITVFTSSLIIL